MANDFKFEPVFRKKPFPLENERKKSLDDSLDDEFKNFEVLFDNISGEKYTVKKTSNVHGIEHCHLVSEAAEKTIFLSKFAINKRFSSQKSETKSLGDRLIVRLSQMF